MSNKEQLRAYFRKVREEVSCSEQEKYQIIILAKLAELTRNYNKIAIFNPLTAELNLCKLKAGQLLFPKIQQDKTLKFYAVTEPLVINQKYGILEPKGEVSIVPEVIICPLLAFDKEKNRLGYGGGYYDRTFKIYTTALKIGVAYSIQQTSQLITIDKNDVALDYIVTEKQILS